MIKTIQHNGLPLCYEVTGKGPAVVLLHGLAEDHTIWQEQTAFLSAGFQVVLPDLPGSGASTLAAETSMENLAEAVKAVLDAEGLQKVVMIGHSMGGYVTLAFAERYPESLHAFGLFHSTAYADGEEKKAARKRNISFIAQHGTLEFLKQAVPSLFSSFSRAEQPGLVTELVEKYQHFNPLSLMAYNQAMLERPDRTGVMACATCPVMMVIGQEDAGIPLRLSLEQSHLADIAYIHVLQRSGHMGFLEEPARSNSLLKKFLEDIYKS